MSSASSVPAGPHSWEQFVELPDLPDGRRAVALIDGEVVWMGGPSITHELICFNLVRSWKAWAGPGIGGCWATTSVLVRVGDRPLGYIGDAGLFPPGAVTLDDRGMLAVAGLPLVAAEVWSPSNWASEIHRKARDYARTGVDELWGVSPEQRVVTRFAGIVDGAYETVGDIAADGVVESPLLPGFRLEVASLFVP